MRSSFKSTPQKINLDGKRLDPYTVANEGLVDGLPPNWIVVRMDKLRPVPAALESGSPSRGYIKSPSPKKQRSSNKPEPKRTGPSSPNRTPSRGTSPTTNRAIPKATPKPATRAIHIINQPAKSPAQRTNSPVKATPNKVIPKSPPKSPPSPPPKPATIPKKPASAPLPVKENLDLVVVGGSGWKDGDLFGKGDPYCQITIAGQSQRTPTINGGGSSATWDHTMTFTDIPNIGPIMVEVFDEDYGRDDQVASGTIDIAVCPKSGEIAIPLQPKGSVTLKFGKASQPAPKTIPKTVPKPAPQGSPAAPPKKPSSPPPKAAASKPSPSKASPTKEAKPSPTKEPKSEPIRTTSSSPKIDTPKPTHSTNNHDNVPLPVRQEEPTPILPAPEITVSEPTEPRISPDAILEHPPLNTPKEKPKVKILIENGSGWRDGDWIGKGDPYCIVKWKGQSKRTKTQNEGGTAAQWNEVLEFDCDDDIRDGVIQIQVYDDDMGKDDFLGEAEVDMGTCFTDTTLTLDLKPAGQLTMKVLD